jgi:histidinol-phosphatase (PHP family)
VFEYVEKAILKGLTEIAFTDHIPLPDNFDLAHRMALNDMELYAKWVNEAKKRYPEIEIRYGIEADYYEGFENYTEEFISKYDFDIVIMSVHFLRHWPDGNWVFDYDFPEKSKAEIYTDYLSTLKDGIQTGLFDVLGHADMVKSTGDSLVILVPDKVDEVLDALVSTDMSIEFNTSGYRKNMAAPYPGLDWISRIKERSLSITIGSDAHHPDQVGLEFDSVYHQIKEQGIKKIAVYEKRRKKLRDL